MGTLISLIIYVAAAMWLFDNDQGTFWWVLLAALVVSALTTAIVQFGSPSVARDSPRSFDVFSSPAARTLLVPMMILNICLIVLVIYAYLSS
jgi:uncharacterized membrane protein